jgi:phage repressor protein C with HTH and peptisase S24 domain
LRAAEIPVVAAYLESDAPFLLATTSGATRPANRDVNRLTKAAAPVPPLTGMRDLPVMGTVVAGSDGMFVMNGEVHDYIERPPSLQGVTSAYAVYVADTSMVPRFFPGETLHVHPGRAITSSEDSFVVVQIRPDDEAKGEAPRALVKRFKRKTSDTLVLEQFNPHGDLVFPLSQVESIHLIIWAGRG